MSNIKELYFQEYLDLDGKYRSFKKYKSLMECFIEHTCDIFIKGDTCKYSTCDAAFVGFCKAAKVSFNEGNKVFRSIDNITAYC